MGSETSVLNCSVGIDKFSNLMAAFGCKWLCDWVLLWSRSRCALRGCLVLQRSDLSKGNWECSWLLDASL